MRVKQTGIIKAGRDEGETDWDQMNWLEVREKQTEDETDSGLKINMQRATNHYHINQW